MPLFLKNVTASALRTKSAPEFTKCNNVLAIKHCAVYTLLRSLTGIGKEVKVVRIHYEACILGISVEQAEAELNDGILCGHRNLHQYTTNSCVQDTHLATKEHKAHHFRISLSWSIFRGYADQLVLDTCHLLVNGYEGSTGDLLFDDRQQRHKIV